MGLAGRARDEGKEKGGRRELWGCENEEMRGEEERRSTVMAGRLPSNLINTVLGGASCSLPFHKLTAGRKERKERAHQIRGAGSV